MTCSTPLVWYTGFAFTVYVDVLNSIKLIPNFFYILIIMIVSISPVRKCKHDNSYLIIAVTCNLHMILAWINVV